MAELLRNVIPPTVSGSSGRRVESLLAIIGGITPKQITKRPTVRQIPLAVDVPDLVECFYFRRESTMQAEDGAIDDG